MIPIMAILLAVFLFLFSGSLAAKPYGTRLCANDSQFTCYTVQKGDTWDKLFANADQRDLVMRVNRMNIPLQRGMIIAVPKDLTTADPLNYSPFSKHISPLGEKVIIVSTSQDQLAFGAYDEQGELKHWGPISSARGYCPDMGTECHTPIGKFAIYRKEGAGCKSTKFPIPNGGAPMPYCMFFRGGLALHGSYEVPGYNDSHGCVRLFVNDAEWLNNEFTKDTKNVAVIISQNVQK
jgi:L,D-transpeptidase ErfK/SrfK